MRALTNVSPETRFQARIRFWCGSLDYDSSARRGSTATIELIAGGGAQHAPPSLPTPMRGLHSASLLGSADVAIPLGIGAVVGRITLQWAAGHGCEGTLVLQESGPTGLASQNWSEVNVQPLLREGRFEVDLPAVGPARFFILTRWQIANGDRSEPGQTG